MDRRAFFGLPTAPPPAPSAFAAPAHGRLDPPPLRPLDIRAGLEPYGAPLDRHRAAHLLRRMAFGAAPDLVETLAGMEAAMAVDVLLNDAVNEPLPPPPPWVDEAPPGRDAGQDVRDEYRMLNNRWQRELRTDWVGRMYYGGLHERMTLFWHNHFVTEIESYARLAVFAYRYLTTLRTHALGNFKAFVHAMGLDPAMLFYLNGRQNRVGQPNENYARELLELFTMGITSGQGQNNYTQQDIEEIARALTGWVVDPRQLDSRFVPNRFDEGVKTFLGRTGAFGYDDVIDILFEERPQEIAAFISRKLYRAFVYAAPDEALVAQMAQVFLENDFELVPLLRTLFQSAHFHDEETVGAQIKPPIVLLTGFLRELHVQNIPEDAFLILDRISLLLEQALFDPPDVSGWDGHHDWLTTTTLPSRWLYTELILVGERGQTVLDLTPLAEVVLEARGENPLLSVSVFTLATALAEHLLPVPLETLDISPPSDGFAGDLVNHPIPEEVLNGPEITLHLAMIFLGTVPWYNWSLAMPEAQSLLVAYVRYLTQLPEFQLT